MNLTLSLFEWIKTFEICANYRKVQDLCDGVAIAHVLTVISPEFFKSEWLSKIEFDVGTNWRLRVSNLRKVYEGVVDFYSEALDKQINEKLLPNVTLIGRDYDVSQLGLLLQLILGCAINCDRKDHFIEVMKNLNLDVQHGLKAAIQELETIEDNSLTDKITDSQFSNYDLQKFQSDLNLVHNAKDEAIERWEELKIQCHKLNEDKHTLQLENERLIEKLKALQLSSDPNSIDNEAIFQRMNHQIISLQTDLSKMEELKEDYRLNAELKEEELNRYRAQIDQLQTKLSDFKQDRDELDRLRYISEEVERYKTMNEVHKKKIEELLESKRQLKAAEDRNASQTKRICELEEEAKKLSVFKGQIELYKKQIQDLRIKIGEENYRADKAEDDSKRVSKKFDELLQEREKYNIEISALKLELSRYKSTNQAGISMDIEYSDSVPNSGSTVELMQKSDKTLSEFNEKLIRLEFENEKLKEKLTISDDERVKLLESQLEDEKLRVIQLENQNRLINQRIVQLEGQIVDLQNNGSDDEQMQTFQDIIKQKEVTLESIKSELSDAQQSITSLKEVLSKKDEELAEREDQYKKYVSKAKLTLDQITGNIASGNGMHNFTDTSVVTSNDVNYVKQLLIQKEIENTKLKTEYESQISFREMEARLMTIAFHNLSSHLQRKSAEERSRSGPMNSMPTSSSFLARQRQATTRKYNMPGVSQRCNCYSSTQKPFINDLLDK